MADIVSSIGTQILEMATNTVTTIHSSLSGTSILYDVIALIVFGLFKVIVLIYTNGDHNSTKGTLVKTVVSEDATSNYQMASSTGSLSAKGVTVSSIDEVASQVKAPAIDIHFEFEQFVPIISAPFIETAFESERLDSILNEEFFQAIEHKALIYAKMTVENMALHDRLSQPKTKISYIVFPEEGSEETDIETALSLHSAAFGEVDEPEDKDEVDAGTVNEGITTAQYEDTESTETPDRLIGYNSQDDADISNENMSMIEYQSTSAATTAKNIVENQLFRDLECAEELIQNYEAEENDSTTTYPRDNLISAYKMFANTIDAGSDSDDESTFPATDSYMAARFDILGREPLPADQDAKEKFKLKLFTIHEEIDSEDDVAKNDPKTTGNLNTFVPVDEMARVGLLFSDDECEDNIMAYSPAISIESCNFDDYESNTVEFPKLASLSSVASAESNLFAKFSTCMSTAASKTWEAVDARMPCDSNLRKTRPLKGSKHASKYAEFKFIFDFPVTFVTTAAKTENQKVDLAPQVTAPVDASQIVSDRASEPTIDSGIQKNDDTPHENDCQAPKRIKYCTDVQNETCEAQDSSALTLAPVCDPAIEKTAHTDIEPIRTDDTLESSSFAAHGSTSSVTVRRSKFVEHTSVDDDCVQSVTFSNGIEATASNTTLGPLPNVEGDDGSSDMESIAAAIDALLLILPTAETDPEGLDKSAIISAIDQLLLLLPCAESSSDIEESEAAATQETSLPGLAQDILGDSALDTFELQADETGPATLQTTENFNAYESENLWELLLPEAAALTHEESKAEAWDTYSQRSEDNLDTSDEAWRIFDRVNGLRLAQCSWTLLDQPNVFYTCSGPLLMLTTAEGETKYPQDMKVYDGQSDWTNFEEDDDIWCSS
ncbi:hypothetical protein SEPCBS119000_006231 [Sporothrix epigloea]|uniref:Uncharacterized protein n=1 Tax=Sporothrix epigloea TaxID=1892477 RepID=A0ABP0E284_9PEZI